MKVGDLVKMRYVSSWMFKGVEDWNTYSAAPAIVVERAHNAVKVRLADGSIKSDLVKHWEVVSENR